MNKYEIVFKKTMYLTVGADSAEEAHSYIENELKRLNSPHDIPWEASLSLAHEDDTVDLKVRAGRPVL